jgi:eukaryotic-like serine/threonine-protein kinase
MELLDGETLATRLARGPFPWEEAVRIAEKVADALEEAHAAGIVHRDVKPGNIMLTDDGDVKVMDFGIAAAAWAVPITISGTTMGTATYIAPEQASGHRATPASDVYSLGVVLYEMLAGRPPFVGSSPVAVATMHVQDEPPPLRTLAPDVPDNVVAACHQALAKNPADRPPSARAFAAMLLSPADATEAVAAIEPDGEQTRVLTPIPGTAVLPQVGGTGTPPQGVAATEAQAAPPASRARTRKRKATPPRRTMSGALLGFLAAAVILLVVLALVLSGTGPEPFSPTSPPPKASSSPRSLSMPGVIGLKEGEAKDRLKQAGLKNIETVKVAGTDGIVVRQDPDVGQSVSPDANVTLYVGSTASADHGRGKGGGKGKGGG